MIINQRAPNKQPSDWSPWLIMLLCVVLASFMATGYHHPDEFMQIIEFANLKLGGRGASDLTWEYHEAMRPWLLPGFFYLLTKICYFFNQTDPFLIWSLYRLISGLVGVYATYLVYQLFWQEKKSGTHKVEIWYVCTFFCLPWIFTRGSSESVGGSIAAISLAVFYKTHHSYLKVILAGLLFGLAFQIRYQLAFMGVGLLIWGVFIQRKYLLKITLFGLSAVAFMGIGYLVDLWGYGKPNLTAWNYFYQNVALKKASQWGESPFLAYLWLMNNHGGVLITLPITLMSIGLIFYKWRTPLFWALLAFVLGHSMVAHKEMRFLFPLAIWIPFLVFIANRVQQKHLQFLSFQLYKLPFKWINLSLLIFLCLWPSRPEVLAQKWIYDTKITEVYIIGRNPYLLGDHPVYFTRNKDLRIQHSPSWTEPMSDTKGEPIYILTSLEDSPGQRSSCEKVWSVFPEFVRQRLTRKILDSAGDYRLFRCRV